MFSVISIAGICTFVGICIVLTVIGHRLLDYPDIRVIGLSIYLITSTHKVCYYLLFIIIKFHDLLYAKRAYIHMYMYPCILTSRLTVVIMGISK